MTATRPAPRSKFFLVVHGGAGTIRRAGMTPEQEKAYRDAMTQAIQAGYAVLSRGGAGQAGDRTREPRGARPRRSATQGDEALIYDDGAKHGTVGAVALDQAGNLAAATSTGGMSNKRWGRVGDSPIIGAGTYADNASCAVSATGDGEYFIRATAARDICARVEYLGKAPETAGREVLDRIGKLGGEGGVIILARDGRFATPFNSEGMYRGWVGPDGKVSVEIYR